MDNTNEDTSNFLNWVEIKNFKSIKDLRLDCKRINVFIGKPNVGKSNILEGLGMLGAEYSDQAFLHGAVRYETVKQLYYDNDVSSNIIIKSNNDSALLIREDGLSEEESLYFFYRDSFSQLQKPLPETGLLNQETLIKYDLDSKGLYLNNSRVNVRFNLEKYSKVRKYDFANLTEFDSLFADVLLPPAGPNLYSVVRRNKELWREFAKLFEDQNLELVLYDEKQEFILQKKDGPYIWQYPFFSIADTFRRFMFYIAAIESNKNSVIVFEEPEVHSFPPYTQELAYRMIYDESNQYFISTHSPYMLHPFIEKMDFKDLNVFVTYYKDYQTYVKALTEEELTDILDFSTNVFFNLSKFEPNA